MMTRSIGYALSWEYWRRGMYWFVPACAALVIGLMTPAYAVLSVKADVRAPLSSAVFGLVCWAPVVMALASRGSLRRQFVLPVPTASLVNWTLANGVVAVAVTYWLVALTFNLFFHTGWPLWEPAWWAAVVYVIFQATVWSLAGGRGALLIPVAFLGLLLVPLLGQTNFHERFVPEVNAAGDLVWPAISAGELAASAAVALACWLAAVYLVARERRGEGWTLAWLRPGWWMQRVEESALETADTQEFAPRSFRSAGAAQFWMEWRSRGRYVVLGVAAVVLVLWTVAGLNGFDRFRMSSALGGLTGMFFLLSPFVGVFLGHRSERFDMKPFLATRPASDGQQALAVLWHVAAVCAAGALVWLAATVVTATVWQMDSTFPKPPPAIDGATALLVRAAILAGFLLAAWTLLGLGAAVGMARSWFVAAAALGTGVLLFALGMLANVSSEAATVFFAAVALGGTATAFVAAWRKKLLSPRILVGAAAAYLVLLAFFLVLGDWRLPSWDVVLLIASYCAAPLAPLAAAPLALAWNRHR